MKWKLNRYFYIDLGLFLLQFINLHLAWHWWHEGNGMLFALAGCGFVFGLWGCRRLFDYAITGFCMWWIQRKAKRAFAFIESLKEESKHDQQDI